MSEEEVLAYEEKIGMKKIIDKQRSLYYKTNGKKGKYWMALSPKGSDFDTKHPISYWVNYGDNNTYGWFTVDQIKQWLTTPDLKLHTLGGTKER